MTSLLFSDSTSIVLPMNMSGRDFAQARLMPYLEEQGFIAKKNAEGAWSFTSWRFSDTSEEDDKIIVKGPLFEGKLLFGILTGDDGSTEIGQTTPCAPSDFTTRVDCVKLVASIQQVLKEAERQSVALPFIGPSQVLCATDGSLLFLPPTLIDRAAGALKDKDYSRYVGVWRRPGLYDDDSRKFCLSACLYAAITGSSPYPLLNSEKRSEDNVDKNYIPLDCLLPGLSENDAWVLNSNLSGIKPLKDLPDINEMLKDTPVFTGVSLQETEQENFEKVATKRVSSITKRVSCKRFVRHHQSGLLFAVIAFVALIFVAISFANNKLDVPSTRGLTSLQTVEAFYTSVNLLDAEQLGICAKGNAVGDYSNIVSSYYVTSKMRETYESIHLLTPAQWLYSYASGNRTNTMFGISDFKIDGNDASTFINCSDRRAKVPAITSENGKSVTDGDKTTYTVTFYMLNIDSEGTLSIEKCKDTVSLQFFKEKWLITKVVSNVEETSQQIEPFTEDYLSLFPFIADKETTSYSKLTELVEFIPQIASSLKSKYYWLPRVDEIEVAKTQVAGSFGVVPPEN